MGEYNVAKLALYDFILGETTSKKVKALNSILRYVGVDLELRGNTQDGFDWINSKGGCDSATADLAEDVFEEIADLFTEEEIIECIRSGEKFYLLSAYRNTIKNIKRRIETLKWIDELSDQVA